MASLSFLPSLFLLTLALLSTSEASSPVEMCIPVPWGPLERAGRQTDCPGSCRQDCRADERYAGICASSGCSCCVTGDAPIQSEILDEASGGSSGGKPPKCRKNLCEPVAVLLGGLETRIPAEVSLAKCRKKCRSREVQIGGCGGSCACCLKKKLMPSEIDSEGSGELKIKTDKRRTQDQDDDNE